MPSRSNSTRQQGGVTFSQYSELALIPKDDNKTSSQKWHSSQEYQNFRRALIEDARRVSSRDDVRVPSSSVRYQHHNVADQVGIEVFLSRGLAQHVQETRRAHIHAVLREQHLQRQRGVCNVERLARSSMKTSKMTSERARILAIGYWLQSTFEKE